jgi:hypothetical protein
MMRMMSEPALKSMEIPGLAKEVKGRRRRRSRYNVYGDKVEGVVCAGGTKAA